MKKTKLLNAALSRVIASMGHGQTLVIADAGLPVPKGVDCIDLAVTIGVPGFWDVLDAVLSELEVETAWIAAEAAPQVAEQFQQRLTAQTLSHDGFKDMTSKAAAIVRTGEATPYCNIILASGVVF